MSSNAKTPTSSLALHFPPSNFCKGDSQCKRNNNHFLQSQFGTKTTRRTGQFSHNGSMHLLTSSRSVQQKHAGAIHQSLAGLLQRASHFLIAFGRLSHHPLDLRVTNQQLTQTEKHMHPCKHPHTHKRTHFQVIYSRRTAGSLDNTIQEWGELNIPDNTHSFCWGLWWSAMQLVLIATSEVVGLEFIR